MDDETFASTAATDPAVVALKESQKLPRFGWLVEKQFSPLGDLVEPDDELHLASVPDAVGDSPPQHAVPLEVLEARFKNAVFASVGVVARAKKGFGDLGYLDAGWLEDQIFYLLQDIINGGGMNWMGSRDLWADDADDFEAMSVRKEYKVKKGKKEKKEKTAKKGKKEVVYPEELSE